MGVLNCDRGNCDSIMSRYYSHRYGYLCYSCFEELVARGPQTDIEWFMQSPKQPTSREDEARARFSAVFEDRDREPEDED